MLVTVITSKKEIMNLHDVVVFSLIMELCFPKLSKNMKCSPDNKVIKKDWCNRKNIIQER